jgi:6-pyruvoyltetrahydropterin/6-carboxytetrahydropterin synthase
MTLATIGRSYTFEAAHQLLDLPPGHKCANMHGHNYRAEVELGGELNEAGMVLDYAGLDLVMDCFLKQLDHKVLNHVPGLEKHPTAENIALWLGEHLNNALGQRIRVRVYENDRSWAEVTVG